MKKLILPICLLLGLIVILFLILHTIAYRSGFILIIGFLIGVVFGLILSALLGCEKLNIFGLGRNFVSVESEIENTFVNSIEDKNSELYKHIADLVDSRIDEICCKKYLQIKDFQSMSYRYTVDDKIFMASLTGKLKNLLGLDRDEPEQIRRPDSAVVQSAACELFAQDSQTDILSVVDSSYEPGTSIYRLILPSSDSNEAVLDLCLDREDARNRILSNGDHFLEPVCAIYRESLKPTSVTVRNRGEAKKNSVGEWVVTRKIEVELK